MRHDLHLRWLRVKRHLRSCTTDPGPRGRRIAAAAHLATVTWTIDDEGDDATSPLLALAAELGC
jgi:hypothetical protein